MVVIEKTIRSKKEFIELIETSDKTIVFKPVIALKVLETEESIPPEIPITNDCALLGMLFA